MIADKELLAQWKVNKQFISFINEVSNFEWSDASWLAKMEMESCTVLRIKNENDIEQGELKDALQKKFKDFNFWCRACIDIICLWLLIDIWLWWMD